MFVLVVAGHGVVGEDDSCARIFKTHDEAHAAMEWDLDSYIQDTHADDADFDAAHDAFIDRWHATCDESEWHIYEAEVE